MLGFDGAPQPARRPAPSDSTARSVQILDDTNQSFGAADKFDRPGGERAVFAIEPGAGGRIIGADHCIQRTEQAHE